MDGAPGLLWPERLVQDWELEGGADGDVVGVGDVVGFGDLRVFVGVAVEEQADGRESVAGFNGDGLGIAADVADFVLQVGVSGVGFLDVVPDALENDLGWDGAFDVKLLAGEVYGFEGGA
jgi:hypothetical protein